MSRPREIWVDAVKVLACVLVVLGHFSQSMVRSGIVPGDALYSWFQMTIYTFHVPLFFICSGYLYQRYSKVDSLRSWGFNVAKKALALGVPYAFFTAVTVCLKALAGDSVNSPADGLLTTLLLEPVAPYWYLYTLFFLFVVTPTVGGRVSSSALLVVFGALKALSILGLAGGLPFAVKSVMGFGVWFAAGMCLQSLGWRRLLGRAAAIAGLAFIPASVAVYALELGTWAEFLVGCAACVCVVGIALAIFPDGTEPKALAFCARYTMSVYLMHTIFAAGLRVMLSMAGVYSAPVHIVAGLVISFVGPVAAMAVMSRVPAFDFLIYPTRYVKIVHGRVAS